MTPLIEEWKAIPGWEELYEASTLGQVRSLDRTVHTTNDRIVRYRGRVLSPKSGSVRLTDLPNDRLMTYRTPKLILLTFIGPQPEGCEAAFVNPKNKTDCTVNNVQWDTPRSYAVRLGRGRWNAQKGISLSIAGKKNGPPGATS